MKLEYGLSKLAIEDIDSIWEYTALNWSTKLATSYYNQIFEAIKIICLNPHLGESIKEVKQHHRSKLIGSQMIINKIENNVILIDRILHQKMDIEDQLND